MFLLALINIILIISVDSDPPSSIPESYFGYYRIYITDYFFSEIISLIVLINIFLFKHSKTQMNILRTIAMVLKIFICVFECLNKKMLIKTMSEIISEKK